MTHEQLKIIEEASQSRAILENEFFRAKVNEMESQIVNGWKNSNPDNAVERESLYLKLQTLKALLVELKLPLMNLQIMEYEQENEEEDND